jgi:hypothetical protein
MGGTAVAYLLGEVATIGNFMFEILEIAAGCLALSVCFMLTTWAVLLGCSAFLILLEEVRQWRNDRE